VDKHPNTLLTKIRCALAALKYDRALARPDALRDLIDDMTNLDHHLSCGGPAPADWELAFATHAPQTTHDHPTDLFRPAQPDTSTRPTPRLRRGILADQGGHAGPINPPPTSAREGHRTP
jgi:hypothetical protein